LLHISDDDKVQERWLEHEEYSYDTENALLSRKCGSGETGQCRSKKREHGNRYNGKK